MREGFRRTGKRIQQSTKMELYDKPPFETIEKKLN
jgi:hypothetical protein